MAVRNPQLVAADWALGPPPDTQNASYFCVAPCAGTLAPGQSAVVQVCSMHAISHSHSWLSFQINIKHLSNSLAASSLESP